MRNFLLLAGLLAVAGCQKDVAHERHVEVLSDKAAVAIIYLPPEPSHNALLYKVDTYAGNINFHKRIFGIDGNFLHGITVYIKTSNHTEWQQITNQRISGNPSYTYDLFTNEIRFVDSSEGWGYAVYIIKEI